MYDEKERAENLLKENIRLARENNRLLRKLWRSQVISFWSRILFLLIVVGLPVLIYRYYVAEYIQDVQDTYLELRETFSSVSALGGGVSPAAAIESLRERIESIE